MNLDGLVEMHLRHIEFGFAEPHGKGHRSTGTVAQDCLNTTGHLLYLDLTLLSTTSHLAIDPKT